MRTKLLFGFVAIILSVTPNLSWAEPPISSSINAKKAAFIRSFIRDIKEPLTVAIERATFDCGETNSDCVCETTTAHPLLDTEDLASDLYLQSLDITDACIITLTIKNSALQSEAVANATGPTFGGALTAIIQLQPDKWNLPIPDWYRVKSWQCYTNIDDKIKSMFKGANDNIATGDASVLSLYEEEPYLGNCIYDSTLGVS